ncbi:hypothetical protein EON65_00770 [archaeon]|nr:MAG: hypothetical protein EON65_00770 [archaeon]
MYQRPKWCLEQSTSDSQRRPIILCEYAHAMGNSGGCLSKYWQLFRDHKHPRIQGGFIWDLIDQGLKIQGKEGYHYGGDFGDLPNTHHFCCNGLLAPDRSLYPGMFETRHLQCPIQVELECSVTDDLVMIVHNLRNFEDLADVAVRVKLCYLPAGSTQMISSQVFEIECDDIKPYRSKHFKIRDEVNTGIQELLTNDASSPNAEWPTSFRQAIAPTAWLDVSIVKLGNTSSWAESDVEIDHTSLQHSHLQTIVQDSFSSASALQQEALEAGDLKAVGAEDSLNHLAITWPNGSSALLDKQLGIISSWKDRSNVELLQQSLDLCMYRAPTDNDKGGDLLSYLAQWKDAGYQDLQRSPNHKIEVVFSRVVGGGVWAVAKWVLVPSVETKRHDVGIEIHCTANYTFLADGSIDIEVKAQVPSYLPPLPRFGIAGALSADYHKVCWFGKGPHEAYDDRKTSAYLSVFQSTVRNLHTPYMRPQENGRRADVAWVMFENDVGSKIVMLPNCSHPPRAVDTVERYYHTHVQGYGFNASRYSMAQLIEAKHDHELLADDTYVYVNIDSRMMGIGGYDSWSPNVDDEFLIKPGARPLEVKVRLYAISGARS